MILENCGDRTLTMVLDDIKRTSIDLASSTLIREDLLVNLTKLFVTSNVALLQCN